MFLVNVLSGQKQARYLEMLCLVKSKHAIYSQQFWIIFQSWLTNNISMESLFFSTHKIVSFQTSYCAANILDLKIILFWSLLTKSHRGMSKVWNVLIRTIFYRYDQSEIIWFYSRGEMFFWFLHCIHCQSSKTKW